MQSLAREIDLCIMGQDVAENVAIIPSCRLVSFSKKMSKGMLILVRALAIGHARAL